ncbi:MAG: ABC transporter ATP-binding protein [Anaerolineaceae bacterium]|nr:MAG: ABC transporter ATP-binding protein [Anaerolineaceae bacterium]
MAQDPLLVVDNVSFRYREREELAIKDISLQLEAGEVLLIAGASGCGKTTLARVINGLIPRSYKGELTGRILIHGQDTSDMSLARISQNVGTVLQDPERQILGTKVINEVAFGLENAGLSRVEILERAEGSMNYLRIADLRDRDTFNLSGGEKQKVALAGVLAMEPSLLLLDEPLASLDPASALDALRLMRELADEGIAILIVEHRVEDVLKISPDRMLFMMDGEVVYEGSTEGVAQSVDYHEVKLPARIVIGRAAEDPPPAKIEFLPGVAPGDEPLVRFDHVSFFYEEGRDVLQDINLMINAGDIIAILGPNGAGKTTLVKHAIGLLKPKSGNVFVEGKDTRDLSVAEVASTLGYVFQSPSHMLFAPSVRDELTFGPSNLGHSSEEIEKEVQRSIDIMNLSGMEEYPPLALSFGQQKRVSIAAILAMGSKILVMDEPTAGQDYKNYMDFMDSILQLPSFESILFITHDVDLAVVYANRVILLNEGRLVGDGKPQEVLSDYKHLEKWRLVPTSLLDVNLEMFVRTQRFMRAEALAHIPS